MDSNFKRLADYILLLPIFVNGLLLEKVVTGLPFDFHWYYLLMISFATINVLKYQSFKIPKYYKGIVIVLCVGALIGIFNSLLLTLKQLILIIINLVYYYYLVKYIGVKKSIRLYLNLSFFICLLGIIQVVICLLDQCYIWEKMFFFLTFHNIGYRLTSIESEPSYLAFSLIPAFAFIILENKIFTRKGAVIVISFLLLNSLVAYIGIMLVLAFKTFNNPSRSNKSTSILGGAIFTALITLIALNSTFLVTRINDIGLIIKSGDWKFKGINQSAYAIITNAFVTFESIKDSLIGPGLGNHISNYFKYIPSSLNDDVNKEEGASLALRFISEYGLFFAIIFGYRLFKNFQQSIEKFKKYKNNQVFLFSFTIWFVIILRLIRQGHYTMNGFFFFITIYLISNFNEAIFNRSAVD